MLSNSSSPHTLGMESCNLGQNLLRHIARIPIFCTHPDKNAYCRKLKDRFPPHLFQCCLWQHKKYTLELLSRNNIAPGVGRGANLFLLDTMVPWREIENCIEMSQQFCPGLWHDTEVTKSTNNGNLCWLALNPSPGFRTMIPGFVSKFFQNSGQMVPVCFYLFSYFHVQWSPASWSPR